MPPPPWLRARSLLARSFWRSCHIVPVAGLLRYPCPYPDLETFFCKMLFQHIFTRKCVPNRFLGYRRNSPSNESEITIPKTSEWQRAAIKVGSRAEPRSSFSPFLGRNGDPRRAGGATGRCAPRLRKSPAHPKGTQYPPPPARDRAGTHLAGANLRRSRRTTCRFRQRTRPAKPGAALASVGRHIRQELRPRLLVLHEVQGAELAGDVVVADHLVPADA